MKFLSPFGRETRLSLRSKFLWLMTAVLFLVFAVFRFLSPESAPPQREALLIGDSRTVGLAEQGKLEEADFFASVGMTAHRVLCEVVSVPHVGKLDLKTLLEVRSYDKIYITLGINELDRPPEETADCFRVLLDTVQTLQPRARVILMGNIHVTALRSRTDPCYNNPAIDHLNGVISQLAEEYNLLYLDPNILTDDACGGLDPRKSADNAHLTGQEYRRWGAWLRQQTAAAWEEANP